MNRLDRFQSFGYSEQLPTAYGTGALEPPDEPEGDWDDLHEHRPETINLVPRCVVCGDTWPCEESERFEEEW